MKAKKATLGDIEDISRLFNQYRIFYNHKSDLSSAFEFLSERLRHEESIIFFAENDSTIKTGFVQLYPLFSSVRMKKVWLLNDLFVAADFRGLGISKILIDRAKDLCRETDACELMLETQKDNLPANRLYEKKGFVLNNHNFYSWGE